MSHAYDERRPGRGGVQTPDEVVPTMVPLSAPAASGAELHPLDALDAADRARLDAPDALARAALWYARRGVAVFPLRPGGKTPHSGTNGHKDATTDEDRVWAWWTSAPLSNIGAPTGDRFDVVDFDLAPGALALAAFDEAGTLPDRIGRAFTPRGTHVFVPPTGDRNRAGLVPGVDYRGAGGYVVLAPSRRIDGRRYRWADPLDVSGWQT